MYITIIVISCPGCQKRKPFKFPKPQKTGFHPLNGNAIIIDYVGPRKLSSGYK